MQPDHHVCPSSIAHSISNSKGSEAFMRPLRSFNYFEAPRLFCTVSVGCVLYLYHRVAFRLSTFFLTGNILAVSGTALSRTFTSRFVHHQTQDRRIRSLFFVDYNIKPLLCNDLADNSRMVFILRKLGIGLWNLLFVWET